MQTKAYFIIVLTLNGNDFIHVCVFNQREQEAEGSAKNVEDAQVTLPDRLRVRDKKLERKKNS